LEYSIRVKSIGVKATFWDVLRIGSDWPKSSSFIISDGRFFLERVFGITIVFGILFSFDSR